MLCTVCQLNVAPMTVNIKSGLNHTKIKICRFSLSQRGRRNRCVRTEKTYLRRNYGLSQRQHRGIHFPQQEVGDLPRRVSHRHLPLQHDRVRHSVRRLESGSHRPQRRRERRHHHRHFLRQRNAAARHRGAGRRGQSGQRHPLQAGHRDGGKSRSRSGVHSRLSQQP